MSERRHSLIAQLIRRLLAAGVGCIVLYIVLQSAARAGLLYYSQHSDIQERSIVREVERLQRYVTAQQLSAKDTRPAETQYLGVVLGVKGEAKGYVTLVFSDKIRTLLKLIPLPRKMSATPDQTEEFNLYAYIKQLIDGNDVEVLLRVADEVAAVMDTLQFYIPTIKDVSTGLRLSLEMIRKYLPAGSMSRIYVDEQPTDAGSYVAGAVALDSGDINTAGVAMFKIKPKTAGVRVYWAQEAPASMTLAEAAAFNSAAVVESDGQVVANGKVTYTYKKKGGFFGSSIVRIWVP